jgi:hypothetical protein
MTVPEEILPRMRWNSVTKPNSLPSQEHIAR